MQAGIFQPFRREIRSWMSWLSWNSDREDGIVALFDVKGDGMKLAVTYRAHRTRGRYRSHDTESSCETPSSFCPCFQKGATESHERIVALDRILAMQNTTPTEAQQALWGKRVATCLPPFALPQAPAVGHCQPRGRDGCSFGLDPVWDSALDLAFTLGAALLLHPPFRIWGLKTCDIDSAFQGKRV